MLLNCEFYNYEWKAKLNQVDIQETLLITLCINKLTFGTTFYKTEIPAKTQRNNSHISQKEEVELNRSSVFSKDLIDIFKNTV